MGKSSIVNRLLGEERLVVSSEAGTTRDAIDTPMRFHGRTLVFIDTAGLRRQSHVEDGIEFYSSLRTRRAIDRADICVLMLDATLGLENQDLNGPGPGNGVAGVGGLNTLNNMIDPGGMR